MRWFSRKKKQEQAPVNDCPAKLRSSEKRRWFYLKSLLSMLETAKDFAMPAGTSDAKQVAQGIDTLSSSLQAEASLDKLQPEFEKQHRNISLLIKEQKSRTQEKEGEYKDIIGILTAAVADTNTDNQHFNENISQQTDNLERISMLEDIRKMKNNLKKEIATLRKVVREKQDKDQKKLDAMSREVSTLKTELEKSRHASLRDGLTGMYNETALNRYLKTLVAPGQRGGSDFSILVVDIDNFNKIESAYNKEVGQRVILAAGQECRTAFPNPSFSARYKNGTFVVILPGMSRKPAVRKAKALSRSLASKRYKIDDALAGSTLSFTVSIGVSSRRKGDTAASVTSRAVQALSLAKNSGAGKVVSEKSIVLLFRGGKEETIDDLYDERNG